MASCVPAILLKLLPICWLSGGHWTLLWKWLWLPKVHPGQIAFWLSPRLHICPVSAGLGGGMVDLGTWNKGQMQLKVGLTQQGKSLYLMYEDISKFNSALHQLCGVFTVQNFTFGAPNMDHGSARIFFKRSIVLCEILSQLFWHSWEKPNLLSSCLLHTL